MNNNSNSISALGFFAASIGVGLVSEIGIISELCTLLARGALISMFTVIFALPSFLLALDKVICATTSGMKRGKFDFKVKHYPTEGFGNDKNMEARS